MRYGDVIHGVLSVLDRVRWSAVQALHASAVNFGHEGRLWYRGEWWDSPLQLMNEFEIKQADAAEVKVMFWGGPPQDRKYRSGTLMEYLIDACLYEMAEGDPDLKLWDFLNQICEQAEYSKAGP